MYPKIISYLQLIIITVWLCPTYAVSMDVLEEMAEIISKKHLDKPKQEAFFAIFPKAINAYLQSLDPHSKYLTAAEYQLLK